MDYDFLGWIVVGLIAGALAKWIMPGKDPGGIIVTILIGIAGGLIGGYIGSMLGFGGSNSNIINVLIATAGAILLLWIYRMIKARQA
ncbi:GlsB/YeaQ/YmgE family stress response membrane protein [Sphingosinicella microcystinivorans]|uniref:Membrane protein n=1 Tax=Sphingosinicella microcystinivorans TaxID=335406 RepID=A0AAD1G202_SPHMI|nr:GlsB/YeaQ/YmgE family stress response membrane protein [Sphingosinicella microcystinivorans]RKS92198.1 putative membrane protein YeaQ/YmgE (transglycosylase-associated protein family) [Sphingosinicella microcystinivorans]BBE35219.1 membrane protein [Sphingosinicella microcystinivorans]